MGRVLHSITDTQADVTVTAGLGREGSLRPDTGHGPGKRAVMSERKRKVRKRLDCVGDDIPVPGTDRSRARYGYDQYRGRRI